MCLKVGLLLAQVKTAHQRTTVSSAQRTTQPKQTTKRTKTKTKTSKTLQEPGCKMVCGGFPSQATKTRLSSALSLQNVIVPSNPPSRYLPIRKPTRNMQPHGATPMQSPPAKIYKWRWNIADSIPKISYVPSHWPGCYKQVLEHRLPQIIYNHVTLHANATGRPAESAMKGVMGQ